MAGRRLSLGHLLLCLPALVRPELFILLEKPHLQKCRGVSSAVAAERRDVDIRDSAGRKAFFIRAPGEYYINFNKIKVRKSLGQLSGDISARIQVPLDTGIGLRFDLPYQAIPETGLLAARCDGQSQLVEVEGRQFCRYCDLCTTSQDLRRRLKDSRHKFLADLPAPGHPQDSLAEICTEIESGSYEIHRKVRIPSPEELEKIAKEKFNVDRLSEGLRDRLERKRGKIQVEVRVMSSPAETGRRAGDGGCHRCCSPSAACYADWENQFQRFVVCSRSACRRDCLPAAAQLVACSIAEFQYSLTEDRDDVRRFLAEHGIDQSLLDPPTPSPAPPPPQPRRFGKRPRPTARARPSDEERGRCVDKLTGVHARICRRFFSSKRPFCCKHCAVCSPLH